MSMEPCKNPNCHSFGKPHPNCECYPGMAEGGEVEDPLSGQPVPPEDMPDDLSGTPVPAEDMPDELSGQPVPPEDMPDELSGQPVPPEDLPDSLSGQPVPPEDMPDEPGSLSMPSGLADAGQRAMGAGLIRSPDGTPEEGTKLTDEDIKKTAQDYEDNFGMASLVTGSGAAGLANKAAGAAADYMRLGKVGSAALKGMLSNGIIEGTTQLEKAILGQGNPEDAVNPVLATGAATLFGGLVGGVGAKISNAATTRLQGMSDLKLASKAEEWLAGVGHAAEGGEVPEGAKQAFKAGYKAMKSIPEKIAGAGAVYGALKVMSESHHEGLGLLTSVITKQLTPLIEMVIKRPSKVAIPATVRWLSNGARGSLFNMIDYAEKAAKGESLLNNSIESLFKAGAGELPEHLNHPEIEKLKAYIDDGGMTKTLQEEHSSQHEEPQNFAEGGKVEGRDKRHNIHDEHAHLAENLPEQNMMLQAARGRVSTYLNSMRPSKDAPKLAFDEAPDQREQEKKYRKALEIAAQPLSILHHVKKGSIDPEQAAHLGAMYPELAGHLQKKITERIVKDQVAGKKPSYVVRQGLSVLMGTPLSGEMTPQNIQAAQMVFQRKEQERESGGSKPTRKPNALTKSDQAYLTDDQAREKRQARV